MYLVTLKSAVSQWHSFIGIGDGFLPEPLSNFSSQTKGKINQSLMDLFPDRKAIDLYEKTDRLIEEVEEVEELEEVEE